MGEVVWLINCTLDGRCGHASVVADDGLHRHATETLEGIDVVLFGRSTFDLLEAHWAEVARTHGGTDAENDFADAMSVKGKVVYSSRPGKDRWNAVHVTEPAEDDVRRRRDDGQRLLVQASPGLARSLRAAGLVDRYRLLVQPVLVGSGPMTFYDGEERDLLLDDATVRGASVALDYSARSRSAQVR